MRAIPHSRNPATRRRNCGIAALALALPGHAMAVQLDYAVGAGLMYTDNVNQDEFDPIDENIFSTRVDFALTENNRHLDLAIRGDAEHLNYLDNVYDDEVRGSLVADLDWTIRPDRLVFSVDNHMGYEPIDFRSNNAPDNLQRINVFSAGPTLMGRLGEHTDGELELRYVKTDAEKTEDFNTDRYSVAARLLRDFDPTQRGGLNLEALQVDFNRPDLYSGYHRRDAFYSHDLALNRTVLHLEAGYSWLDLEGYSATYDAPRLRATADVQLSPRSRVHVDLAYQFAEAAHDLVRRLSESGDPFDPTNPGDPIDPGIPDGPTVGPSGAITPDVYRERRVQIGYSYVGERLTFDVNPYYSRNHYLNSPIDNRGDRGISLDLGYRLTPRTDLSVSAWASSRKYDSFPRKDKDLSASIGVSHRFTRHWSGQAEVRRLDRDSNANGGSYVENVAFVSITYRR